MKLQTCVMCGEHRRKSGSIYCSNCLIYEAYEDTEWYKELLKSQQRQYRINQREGYPLLIEHEANLDGSPVIAPKYLKAVGRPKVADSVREKVIAMFLQNPKISMRVIEREMKKQGHEVSRETIRSYLLPIRKLL